MGNNLFLFFFFLGTVLVFSQDRTSKVLNGRVVVPNVDVTGVAIQNISTEKAAVTDPAGNFSIRVRLGDTLVFSAVQLKRKILPIGADLMATDFVTVPMEEFVNELEGVELNPFGLSGNLGSDVGTLTLEKDVSAEALGLPNADVKIITQSERKLYEADAGKFFYYYVIAASVNINKILNRLTGRTKKLKQRVEVDRRYANTNAVQESIVDSLFTQELGIPEERIPDFMYFCEVDSEFQRLSALGDQLQLWNYLLNRSKLYRKNNELD
ncbi:hypothetical protein ABV409_16510 [Flagellimonas sp. DF-77]|uniref:hypothetical protein n=1 Tax=Flagellimonas algarum TaxID=3230298 RepID=UPI003391E98C